MSQKSDLFNDRIKDIFIGEKINGNSGHVNLMKIKSRYFEDKFKELNELIDEKSKQFDDSGFREELYDKLYNFVKKYFSESGSVYFSYTPLDEKVYERVYDSSKDVSLFWKTHMLYYVKTGQVWNELELEDYKLGDNKYDIKFNIDNIDGRLANEKKEIVFEIDNIESNNITFDVSYTSTGYGMSESKKDKIRRLLKSDYNINTTNDKLGDLFSKFRKQNEVDYFINKNAESFLKEQFDMQIKNYLLDDDTMFNPKRLNQIKSIRDVGYKLIEFVSQFEEELSRIWNKPRAVRNLNIVLTYNKLVKYTSEEFAKKWIQNGKIDKQIQEWINIDLVESDEIDILNYLSNNPTMPLDTKYFNSYKLRKEIDDIGEKLDGELIKSENYQGLNTISNKYRDSIESIYIDPPFNKNENANFDYKVKYQDSTWITLLENRINLCKDLMYEKSSIFVRSDDNGNSYLKLLLDDIFGSKNRRNEITLRRGSDKSALYSHSKYNGLRSLGTNTDSLFFYTLDKNLRFNDNRVQIKRDNRRDPYWTSFKKTVEENASSPNMNYEVCGVDTEDYFGWMWTKKRGKKAEDNYKEYLEIKDETGETIEEYWKRTGKEKDFIRKNDNGTIQYWVEPKEYTFLNNLWNDINGYSSRTGFKTENSEKLLKRVIQISSEQNDTVMDFFMGSGTTTATAHKMNRYWIGIELSTQFYDIALPRMKKVISYDSGGISSQVDTYNKNDGGMFKYYELEQYEDILKNMSYSGDNTTLSDYSENWDEYLFMSDEKLAGPTISRKDGKVNVQLDKLYSDIDIPETLSLLTGYPIQQIKDNKVILDDNSKEGYEISTDNPDIDVIKPLLWWGEQI